MHGPLNVKITKMYLPVSVLCFLALNLRSWLSLFKQNGPLNLSHINFHASSPMYALNRAQMRAIFLSCAKVPQNGWFVWFANLAAFFCTRPNAFICPSLYGPQHEVPYSRIGQISDMQPKLFILLFPFWRTRIMKCVVFEAFCAV